MAIEVNEKIRVLIADDNERVVDHIQSFLLLDDKSSFDVFSEGKSENVLQKINEIAPHVVLLDDEFEGEKLGIAELLPKIRSRFHKVQVIILTSKRLGNPEPIKNAFSLKANNFLDKQGASNEIIRKAIKKAYQDYLAMELNEIEIKSAIKPFEPKKNEDPLDNAIEIATKIRRLIKKPVYISLSLLIVITGLTMMSPPFWQDFLILIINNYSPPQVAVETRIFGISLVVIGVLVFFFGWFIENSIINKK